MLAISSDDRDSAEALVGRVGLEFPVLFNPDHDVIEQYGVWNLHGDRLAAPAYFVFDQEGALQWSFVSSHAYDHPSMSEVVEIAKSL